MTWVDFKNKTHAAGIDEGVTLGVAYIDDVIGGVEIYDIYDAVESVERDKLMPHRGTLSVAKAMRLLGYEPRNPLEAGLEKYVQWYRELSGTGEPIEDLIPA